MEKQIITFKAGPFQELVKTSGRDTFASNTVNYIEAQFDLTHNWQECTKIYAIWYYDESYRIETKLNESGSAMIPPEMITREGLLSVNLCGYAYDKGRMIRITSFPVEAFTITRTRTD